MTHRSKKDYIIAAEFLSVLPTDGEACLIIILRVLRELLTPILKYI
jgi:hypothetical protein